MKPEWEKTEEERILEKRVCNAIYCLRQLNRKAFENWDIAWRIQSSSRQEAECATRKGDNYAKKAILIEAWIEKQILGE